MLPVIWNVIDRLVDTAPVYRNKSEAKAWVKAEASDAPAWSEVLPVSTARARSEAGAGTAPNCSAAEASATPPPIPRPRPARVEPDGVVDETVADGRSALRQLRNRTERNILVEAEIILAAVRKHVTQADTGMGSPERSGLRIRGEHETENDGRECLAKQSRSSDAAGPPSEYC